MVGSEKFPFSSVGIERGSASTSQFRLRSMHEISPEELEQIANLYEQTYESLGLFIGGKKFEELTLSTTSAIATISENDRLLAAGNLNGDRLGMVASKNGTEHVRKGLIGELIANIQNNGIAVWMTISTGRSANGMLAAVTAQDVQLSPVNDVHEVVRLFSDKTSLSKPRNLIFTDVEHEFLTYRLKKKGVEQNTFLAVSSIPSVHGPSYQQIVFR